MLYRLYFFLFFHVLHPSQLFLLLLSKNSISVSIPSTISSLILFTPTSNVSQESSASGASLEETSLRCLVVETERQGPADSERPSGDLHPLTLGDFLASPPGQPQASRKNRRSSLKFVIEEDTLRHPFLDDVVAKGHKLVSDEHWRFKHFPHGELVLATTNFSDDKKMGEGEFGSVFRGNLSDLGSVVAVKKISRVAIKRKREFVRELLDINELLWHENLLELIGWSYNCGELLIVSEFMSNGSCRR
ncbi:hypothetical protein MRB53_007294 [Persea americana]|uniref:Uncharacterized protein n=1 Tax=Persea americana TaxID=3435 RepID=A0ACC2MJG7_PERAE|nr:hypothetical protein MRB53_007294 [Persea americana]